MTNRYKPIDAPITPERQAALDMLKSNMEYLEKMIADPKKIPTHIEGFIPKKPKQPSPSKGKRHTDYESYRDDFELYILENYYCPLGLGQFTRNPAGKYTKVAYDKQDTIHFNPIESLWHAFKFGLSTKL